MTSALPRQLKEKPRMDRFFNKDGFIALVQQDQGSRGRKVVHATTGPQGKVTSMISFRAPAPHGLKPNGSPDMPTDR